MRTTETQIEAFHRVAEQLGFDVLYEFADESVSGASALGSRTGGRELLSVIGEVDGVIVYRVDRLARSTADLLEAVETFRAAGVELWSVADLPFPAAIAATQVAAFAAFAETERIAIVGRMRSGVQRVAEEGKWLSGPIPFGYDLDAAGFLTPSIRLVAGMTEAELARSIFQRLAAGSSTVKEARRMNELGVFPGRRYSRKVVTMRRSMWFPSRINAMVRKPLYKGNHCVDTATGRIERNVAALVSPDLWQRAQDRLRANRSCEPGRLAVPNLLRGLVYCDDCGLAFAATRTSNKRTNWAGRYYRCSGQIGVVEPDPELRCRAKAIPADSLEQLIWTDCLRMEPAAEGAEGFDARRPIVQRLVQSIRVHTVTQVRPKVAHVRITYTTGEERTFRFARNNGVAL